MIKLKEIQNRIREINHAAGKGLYNKQSALPDLGVLIQDTTIVVDWVEKTVKYLKSVLELMEEENIEDCYKEEIKELLSQVQDD